MSDVLYSNTTYRIRLKKLDLGKYFFRPFQTRGALSLIYEPLNQQENVSRSFSSALKHYLKALLYQDFLSLIVMDKLNYNSFNVTFTFFFTGNRRQNAI